jgi:hypothetical protein
MFAEMSAKFLFEMPVWTSLPVSPSLSPLHLPLSISLPPSLPPLLPPFLSLPLFLPLLSLPSQSHITSACKRAHIRPPAYFPLALSLRRRQTRPISFSGPAPSTVSLSSLSFSLSPPPPPSHHNHHHHHHHTQPLISASREARSALISTGVVENGSGRHAGWL